MNSFKRGFMSIGLLSIQVLLTALVLSQTHLENPFSEGLFQGIFTSSIGYITGFIVVLFFNWQTKANEDFMK